MAKAGVFETKELARIPIAEFRAKHRIPDLHMKLYRPVFDQYRERYDDSLYLQVPAEGQARRVPVLPGKVALDALLVRRGIPWT